MALGAGRRLTGVGLAVLAAELAEHAMPPA